MSEQFSQEYNNRFYTPRELPGLTPNALVTLGALRRVAGAYGSDITGTMDRLAVERNQYLKSPEAITCGSARAFQNQLGQFAPVAAAVLAIETAEFLREAC